MLPPLPRHVCLRIRGQQRASPSSHTPPPQHQRDREKDQEMGGGYLYPHPSPSPPAPPAPGSLEREGTLGMPHVRPTIDLNLEHALDSQPSPPPTLKGGKKSPAQSTPAARTPSVKICWFPLASHSSRFSSSSSEQQGGGIVGTCASDEPERSPQVPWFPAKTSENIALPTDHPPSDRREPR